MNPFNFSSDRCTRIAYILYDLFDSGKELTTSISFEDIGQLRFSCDTERRAELSDVFDKPMVWIGIYIAIASWFCIFAMAADLWHGFRHKKLWFPCKCFTLNAASITVIAVTMKLPVDLTSGSRDLVDQGAKLASLGFMCTMMANLMPSLASMDNKALLANVIGMCVLVITIIANICIQVYTGAIEHLSAPERNSYLCGFDFVVIAYIYMAMILLLLMIMISSSLTIPASKEILESKYRKKIALSDQQIQMSVVEKLNQHVRRYWVMAETGSPQFVTTSNPLSTASGVICVIVIAMNSFMLSFFRVGPKIFGLDSPYKLSTLAILATQSIGVLVGAIAPVSRCFWVFRFKFTTKLHMNYFNVFKVDKYWTQKLHEWKQSPMVSFLSNSRRSRSLILCSKYTSLSLCIAFQKVIIISCKMIWLIVITVPLSVLSFLTCLKSLKAKWFDPTIASNTDDIDEDLSNYVVQMNNDMKLAEKTLKRIAKSMSYFILKAEKEQNDSLLELLRKSTGFEGVVIFDTDLVQPLLCDELVNSWSLPIVTLACIAIALPNIRKVEVESLVRSVVEGLSFTHLVEESLNNESKYVNIRKTSLTLWHEFEYNCKWLDHPLANDVFKGKTATKIIKWFSDKAKEIVTDFKERESADEEFAENLPHTLIAANSMYRITQTILVRCQSKIEIRITKKQLFAHLSGMIADIFCACFTNIPRVITMRCQESVIEKREASVKVAARLLGNTRKIIERLEASDIPSMEDEKKAYIDEWRLYLKQSIP
ncbi:hypothetical protein R6Q59_004523 [Mikania micrantha]|uniref:Uncharacterized protein n=1 Tax=Mikania micrantha TaxID=192012 RepID=A0A5N6MNT7_9ASTR|nr:hypothetical protein E3N88_31144 [Mikania micrantha]